LFGQLGFEAMLGWEDMLLHEGAHALLQCEGARGMSKVHSKNLFV
jgi:hypothetical protein